MEPLAAAAVGWVVGCTAVAAASALLAGPVAGAAAAAGLVPAGAPVAGSPAVLSGASGSPEPAFKSRCSAHLTYRQLTRASTRSTARCADERGQVFQYRSGAGDRSMLLDVTDTGGGIWDTPVEVRLPSSPGIGPLHEGDIVEVWGMVAGATTTRTRFGGNVHVPVVDARYVTVLQSIASSVTTPAAT